MSRPVFGLFRATADRANSVVKAVGIFLIAGFAAAAAGTLAFAELAEHVESGSTTAFDDAVLLWLGRHHTPFLDAAMLELTALGTGTVVFVLAGIVAMFLVLTLHRWSAILLFVSTAGGIALNGILKIGFHRPRPHVIEWGTNVVSSSFPSGHAMSAAIVYGTIAYLAARLHKHVWAKILTMTIALIVIVLICVSRMYLGVHYPTDVAAGVVIGFAWAGFCMATLEALQLLTRHRSPGMMSDGEPQPPPAR